MRIPLRAGDLSYWDVARGRPVVESGTYDILVGASATDVRGRAALRVSADAPATIEVRADHPTRGRLLGTVAVPATGDRYAWTEATAALRREGGRHDVYLVFTAPARLDTVRLS